MKEKLIAFIRVCFYAVIKPIIWFYVVVFQHVRFHKKGFTVPKGPVLFVSNHLTNWDGLYLNCMFFNRIIRFIVHDDMFKNKFMAWCAKNLLGEVCRGRTNNSISDVKEMKRLASKGATVGLFPEGDIDMFGRTLPIGVSVAKYAKLLGIPIVLTKVQGACIRAPRWADKARHSKITYSITDVISVNDVKKLPTNELHNRILSGIVVDEYAYQNEKRVKQFPSKKRAEWLELGLFYCPNCKKFETLKSENDRVYCTNCCYEVKYNRYCNLEPINGALPFTVLTEWDDEQKRVLNEKVKEYNSPAPFLQAQDLDFYQIDQSQYFKKPLYQANLSLYNDRLDINSKDGNISILLSSIDNVCLQYKDVLDLYYDNKKIRLRTKKRKWSAYLYVLAIKNLINKMQEEKKDEGKICNCK